MAYYTDGVVLATSTAKGSASPAARVPWLASVQNGGMSRCCCVVQAQGRVVKERASVATRAVVVSGAVVARPTGKPGSGEAG